MNLLKLSKYLAGELINKKVIEIPDFVGMLENNVDLDLAEYKNGYDGITTTNDYKKLLQYIFDNSGRGAILFILKRFGLKETFTEYVDLTAFEEVDKDDLGALKESLLKEFDKTLKELNATGKGANKGNGNIFEELCEKFLLHSSYFEPGFKEFEFEDGTDKIDRLLKLKKDIGNFGKQTNYLGYVILEAKFKKNSEGKKQGENGSGEVNQLEIYIKRLNKYGISKYAIVITSSVYKDTYKTKIGDYCRERVIEQNPFYLSLLTTEEIREFLENKGKYENMTFDDFIERSFIKWLK